MLKVTITEEIHNKLSEVLNQAGQDFFSKNPFATLLTESSGGEVQRRILCIAQNQQEKEWLVRVFGLIT